MGKSYYTPLLQRRQTPRALWYAPAMTKTLIESWLEAERATGKNKTEATAALNTATGMRYTVHRLS